MEVYRDNGHLFKSNIFIYSTNDIRSCWNIRYDFPKESNPVRTEMLRIFSELTEYSAVPSYVTEDGVFKGSLIEFQNASKQRCNGPYTLFARHAQIDELDTDADQILSFEYEIKRTNVKIKGTFFTKEDRVIIRVLLSEKEIY